MELLNKFGAVIFALEGAKTILELVTAGVARGSSVIGPALRQGTVEVPGGADCHREPGRQAEFPVARPGSVHRAVPLR